MILIGKTYLSRGSEASKLCADISVDGRTAVTLWFSIGREAESWLCVGRADAFVMALLPAAIREGHDIVCEDPLSNRLHYQLNEQLIPAMCFAFQKTAEHFPRVKAPLSNAIFQEAAAIAASLSDREAFSRTLRCHRQESLYPLTHIAVWNTDGDREAFLSRCREAAELAEARHLQTIFLDTNFDRILPDDLDASRTFRALACALSVERRLSLFLLPTARPAASFKIDPRDSESYALLIANSAVTESLSVYLDGPEAEMVQKTARSHENAFIIGVPYIEEDPAGKTRLCARVTLQGREQVMWFSVNSEYGRYLTRDRTDAFVAALLTPALRAGADIISQAPVSRSLLYQLNQYLIPMMSLNMSATFRPMAVEASLIQTAPDCSGAVCTSGTAGADCIFSVYEDGELPADSGRKLTHLFLASNGAIERGVLSDTLQLMVDRAERRLAPETGLKVIGIDSNLSQVLSENFLSVSCIRHAAVLLALQGLFSAGLIPSDYAFEKFEFVAENSGYYELALLSCLSTRCTAFYSSGGAFSRIKKLGKLRGFPLARKTLHPCIDETAEGNCGECLKCIRTEAALYALDALDDFSEVFDANAFRRKKTVYFAKVLLQCRPAPFHATDYIDVRDALKEKGENLFLANLLTKGVLLFRKCPSRLRQCIRHVCRMFPRRG